MSSLWHTLASAATAAAVVAAGTVAIMGPRFEAQGFAKELGAQVVALQQEVNELSQRSPTREGLLALRDMHSRDLDALQARAVARYEDLDARFTSTLNTLVRRVDADDGRVRDQMVDMVQRIKELRDEITELRVAEQDFRNLKANYLDALDRILDHTHPANGAVGDYSIGMLDFPYWDLAMLLWREPAE